MKILIKGGKVINEGKIEVLDILIKDERIEKIAPQINDNSDLEINAEGKLIFPGVIDDQVHFREPGLTHKGDLYTEPRAAVAGGITSFMEMPNTVPNATTIELLEDKYKIAAQKSIANYSFFMGTTNNNLEELKRVDPKNICGIKIFMGSSTGNMLVDDQKILEKIFSEIDLLIATHCEVDPIIKKNQAEIIAQYGEDIDATWHWKIRSEEACYASSSMAVEMAKKFGTRLHILHISTAKETRLFENNIPLRDKKITAEACIHHLWFSNEDYASKGNFIKWNPAVKLASDRDEIFKAVLDNRIDVIATDHAPHSIEEKSERYLNAPSGGPLVQHSLLAMLEFYNQGKITLTKIADKMSHNVAEMFSIKDRGFIREGYFADLVIVDPTKNLLVEKENLLYKCKWSPFEGYTFKNSIEKTIVNGNIVWDNGKIIEGTNGKRLQFDR